MQILLKLNNTICSWWWTQVKKIFTEISNGKSKRILDLQNGRSVN